MSKILVMIGGTIGSCLGWWLGAFVGFMTAFLLSIIGLAAGTYWARGVAKEYFD